MPKSFLRTAFRWYVYCCAGLMLRRACQFLRIGFLIALTSQVHALATDYYVDSGRSSSGDGSKANPWKELADINWGTIQSALSTGTVKVCFSTRAAWTGAYLTIAASGTSASNTLYVSGDELFNTNSSGPANWLAETNGKRARIAGTGSSGGTTYIDAGRSNIVLQGLEISQPTWGGIVIGQQNPATNIMFVTVTNCFVHDVVNSTGISMLFAEAGCHDVIVTHCVVTNTPAEGIYLGHFSYLAPTITNCVVEYNQVVDTGLQGEGDIDIKPGVKGAIIRYNTHYRTAAALGGGNCGVVVLGSDCQIYGNRFHHAAMKSSLDWGYGIYVCADGDGMGTGQSITNCLIYNNLLYANNRNGIRLLATTATSGADIRGVRIWNNTIWGNSVFGVEAAAYGGRTIEILDFMNNIVGNNSNYDISISGNVTLASANNNLYYRDSGNSWYFNGENTLSAWRSLGFDTNGKVGDPMFLNATAADFELLSGSPAVGGGVPSTFFNTDILGAVRGRNNGLWDIGAFQRNGPLPPQNVRVL